jgi:inhibitor of KinA sporulation pathway (predicted exonuclease)
MKILAPLLLILIAGCTTVVPVTQKFPAAVPALTEKCEDLRKIEGDRVAITDMLKTIVENYSLYYQCSAKVDGWNEWYQQQKKIYEAVK